MRQFSSEWRRGLYEAILRRRDMRTFRPDRIPAETLARILLAAHRAGSVGFMQPWNFIIVQEVELRRKIQAHVESERLRAADKFQGERRDKYLGFKLEGILDAPINICVTCDRTRFGPAVLGRNTVPDTDMYSTCCAIQNLWLAARAEGIGVGWVSILEPARLREFLRIPDHVAPLAYLCAGFVDNFPDEPMLQTAGWLNRLPLSEVVFSEYWGERPDSTLFESLTNATFTIDSSHNVEGA